MPGAIVRKSLSPSPCSHLGKLTKKEADGIDYNFYRPTEYEERNAEQRQYYPADTLEQQVEKSEIYD